ncbi:hypothetical protein TPHA_0O01860 [Tetrapisispora phaffii CBS 4417]|uniref:4-nitrophenylphosphatase n=1 Tax=Tetrapisispora phaffii (strain ATCC 24235 / CBS 4417 / NBRC 1672 / NRRL Y-8282 / UCD 70-5) TaxID=1071381 RepID=G8C1X5_TETPH|nr:hypothetical protein TPHA_0O01860 [Tetrapisispora phaffii CBS 4417]CCE66153.1 hypothetical protein TPHA_0O01860 [Tetrapisispora phaffii CBS 4417]
MSTYVAPIKITNGELSEEFIDKFDTFLFDCDGVLWLGTHLLPSITETLSLLESKGKQLIFVTNNSTKSRKAYTHKFADFGITVKEEQIFTSGYASAIYVRDFLKLQPGKDKVWIFGQSGIREELGLMGYETLGCDDPRLNEKFDAKTSPFLKDGLDNDVKCVVAGLDNDINYHRLAITLQYLQQDGVAFVGTNVDSTFPQKGLILPGAGSMIESAAFAANKRPAYCGKPNMNMLNTIISAFNLNKQKCCMVGDRLNTDIRFGVEGGLGGTLLVLTGIETEERAVTKTDEYPNPKYYINKLGDLYEFTH